MEFAKIIILLIISVLMARFIIFPDLRSRVYHLMRD